MLRRVKRGRLRQGESILIHGGSSGIGTTAIQLAQTRGSRVFATAGSAEKCAACERLGAERCIDYRDGDFVAEVRALTDGRGVDVILDMVGGDYAPKNLKCLALEGRLVQIAFLKGSRIECDWRHIMLKRLTVTGSTLRAFTLPPADAPARVAAAKGSPGTFALKPGDRLRIDVTGIPMERQAAVKTALETRLKEVGYVPDESAPVALAASVDVAGIRTTVTYTADVSGEYVRRPAKLQLVFNGKELWSEAWCAPPPLVPQPAAKERLEKYLERVGAGEPNYDLFKQVPVPAYVAAPTAPVAALGASEFTPDGIRDGAPR
jgi:NAD(P)-dependent dehydrogenase (short-subunit alcohol dehydrogenase family)